MGDQCDVSNRGWNARGEVDGLTSQSRLGQSRTITSASPTILQVTDLGGGVGPMTSLMARGFAVTRVAAERRAAVAIKKCIVVVVGAGAGV